MSYVFFSTSTVSCYSVSIGMGGAAFQTAPIVQSGHRVRTVITVIVVRAVTQSAVRVATQTLPLLFVLKESLRTVCHAQALVEKVILLTACTKNSFQHRMEEQFSTLKLWRGMPEEGKPCL